MPKFSITVDDKEVLGFDVRQGYEEFDKARLLSTLEVVVEALKKPSRKETKSDDTPKESSDHFDVSTFMIMCG